MPEMLQAGLESFRVDLSHFLSIENYLQSFVFVLLPVVPPWIELVFVMFYIIWQWEIFILNPAIHKKVKIPSR